MGHDISAGAPLKAHEHKRQNLLEHHLRLPQLVWRQARVLEFGPGSGENAAALARLGARMTLVEPLDYLIERLKKNFAECGVAKRIDSVHQGVLESFETERRFDAVFAEGFIHFLDDGPAAVRRLCSYLAPEGFLVVSVVHPAGTFIEFIKKCYLELACASLGRSSDAERYALARRLFEPAFARINHSRGFESWSKDCVLNPLYRPAHFLDLPEILAALENDVVVHSSWPNYRDSDDLIWHKNVRTAEDIRRATLDGYYARVPHFLHSIPQPDGRLPLFRPADGRAILAALSRCYAALDKAIWTRKPSTRAAFEAMSKLSKALKPFRQSREALRVVEPAADLFKSAAGARTEAQWIAAWARRPALSRLWGSPGHYFVFHKTSLHPAR